MGKVNLEPEYLVWPITKDSGNPVNQSNFKANTCSRRKARENLCERVMIGFGFGASFINVSQSHIKANAYYFGQLSENHSSSPG